MPEVSTVVGRPEGWRPPRRPGLTFAEKICWTIRIPVIAAYSFAAISAVLYIIITGWISRIAQSQGYGVISLSRVVTLSAGCAFIVFLLLSMFLFFGLAQFRKVPPHDAGAGPSAAGFSGPRVWTGNPATSDIDHPDPGAQEPPLILKTEPKMIEECPPCQKLRTNGLWAFSASVSCGEL